MITDLKRGIASILMGLGMIFMVLAFKVDYDFTMWRYEKAKEKVG